MVHLEESQLYCPTGHVAYPKDSPMDLFLKEKEAITKKADTSGKPGATRRPKAPVAKGPCF